MLHLFVYFGDTGNVANEFEEMCHVGVFGEEESIYLVIYLENMNFGVKVGMFFV